MTILFIFLDGVGLGLDDDRVNPFASEVMPNLQNILGGCKLVADTGAIFNEKASLLSLDACLGVDGLPQSATGQAVLLTGKNVPADIGYHYGPKPDKATAAHLKSGGIFGTLVEAGRTAALMNAYPPVYFGGIHTGRRIFSSIPLAVSNAGLPLFTIDDLRYGKAISADFTAHSWAERLGVTDIPMMSFAEAGAYLGDISRQFDFSFFEYWQSDYVGHGQDMGDALALLCDLDMVIGSLVDRWNDKDMILITSDHGNLEDLSTRRHTVNPVPLVLIGNEKMRRHFIGIRDLSEITPAILRALDVQSIKM